MRMSSGPVEEDGSFEVERIMAERPSASGEPEYHIKWLGWPVEESTWEPLSFLNNCPNMLKVFKSAGGRMKPVRSVAQPSRPRSPTAAGQKEAATSHETDGTASGSAQNDIKPAKRAKKEHAPASSDPPAKKKQSAASADVGSSSGSDGSNACVEPLLSSEELAVAEPAEVANEEKQQEEAACQDKRGPVVVRDGQKVAYMHM